MQDRVNVIGFGGQLGTGKDTAADYLCKILNDEILADAAKTKNAPNLRWKREAFPPFERVPLTWQRTAFANAVKQVYMDVFNVDRDFIEKWKREDDPPPGFLKSVRKSLQFIGDGFRSIQGDVWLESVFRDEYSMKIISDLRYINEALKIHEYGGMCVLVWRPWFENDDSNLSEAEIKPLIDWCLNTNQNGQITYLDISRPRPEGLQYFDVFLRNDGTIENLHEQTLTHVRSLMVPRNSSRDLSKMPHK